MRGIVRAGYMSEGRNVRDSVAAPLDGGYICGSEFLGIVLTAEPMETSCVIALRGRTAGFVTREM